MKMVHTLIAAVFGCIGLLTFSAAGAAEVDSPESFLRTNYGWTITGLDESRGLFGKYRAFNCFDDRPGPPANESELKRMRWGTQCNTKRENREDLGAMISISWVNLKHPKPLKADEMFRVAAKMMAGKDSDQAYSAKCGDPETRDRLGTPLLIYDCSMILPFGTYFASFVQFSHQGWDYFVRVQNASSRPIPNVPGETARRIADALEFVPVKSAGKN